jgi:hypothetical protein
MSRGECKNRHDAINAVREIIPKAKQLILLFTNGRMSPRSPLVVKIIKDIELVLPSLRPGGVVKIIKPLDKNLRSYVFPYYANGLHKKTNQLYQVLELGETDLSTPMVINLMKDMEDFISAMKV